MKWIFSFIWILIFPNCISAQVSTGDAHKAVARVVISDSTRPLDRPIAFGTGFFVDQQTLITNYHVISQLFTLASDSSSFKGLLDSSYIEKEGQRYPIKGIINLSPKDDLAVLQVENHEEFVLELAGESSTGSIKILGFPVVDEKLEYMSNLPLRETTGEMFSQNIFSLCNIDDIPLRVNFFGNFKGGSGSPILNETGQVVGILTQYQKKGGIACGVKVKYLKALLEIPPIQSKDMYNSVKTQIVNSLNHAIKGDQNAQYAMGTLLFKGRIPKGLYVSDGYVLNLENMEELGLALLTNLAEKGSATAQRYLGFALSNMSIRTHNENNSADIELENDPNVIKGLRWVREAADQGNAVAQYDIFGFIQGTEKGMDYLRQSAHQNYLPARYALYEEMASQSLLEIQMDYVNPENISDTFETFQKLLDVRCAWLQGLKELADYEYPQAQFNLARFMERMVQFNKDDYMYSAMSLYQKAADQGYGIAQLRLGQLYYYGHKDIVAAEEEKASYWLLRAKQNGFFTPFNDEMELLTTLRAQPEDSFAVRVSKLAKRIKIYFSQIFEGDEYEDHIESNLEEPDTNIMNVEQQDNSSFTQEERAKFVDMAGDYFDQCLSNLNI